MNKVPKISRQEIQTQSAAAGALPTAESNRMPVIFLPHGGGPWPFVDLGMDAAEVLGLSDYLRGLQALSARPATRIVVISAHWEAEAPTVMTAAHPPMLFDYYGFPDAAYHITWPAPGDPGLAERVRQLLGAAGFATAVDPTRGFDHGTFVPLKLMVPEANIPTVQLSLQVGLDPRTHLAIGRALAPLRDEGVLIVGSGMSFHNLRLFGTPRARRVSTQFDAWLADAMSQDATTRFKRLVAWEEAPAAREAHPREEHLLPLMVATGAAGIDAAHRAFSGTMMQAQLAAYHFA